MLWLATESTPGLTSLTLGRYYMSEFAIFDFRLLNNNLCAANGVLSNCNLLRGKCCPHCLVSYYSFLFYRVI